MAEMRSEISGNATCGEEKVMRRLRMCLWTSLKRRYSAVVKHRSGTAIDHSETLLMRNQKSRTSDCTLGDFRSIIATLTAKVEHRCRLVPFSNDLAKRSKYVISQQCAMRSTSTVLHAQKLSCGTNVIKNEICSVQICGHLTGCGNNPVPSTTESRKCSWAKVHGELVTLQGRTKCRNSP